MGLLFHNLSKDFQSVADRVFNKQFEVDPKLETEYDEYRKNKMYEDILHNLSFLEVSLKFNDKKIFHVYSIWLLELMIHLMPDLTIERIKEHMNIHYKILTDELDSQLNKKEFSIVKSILDDAIKTTNEYKGYVHTEMNIKSKYQIPKEKYLNFLLEGNSRKAIDFILEIKDHGIPLEDIYVDILQEVMIEIGELWHQNKITVDQEHYMTSITQVALSQFYDTIFSTARNNHKLLSCSVGSELHEMGARMVSDLFEYHGWDSTYLGAAIPEKVFLQSIESNKPDLIVLSVTMPQHLDACYELVKKINLLNNPPKIAVGGRAFTLTNKVWKKWPVDISTNTAKELLTWAEKNFA